MTEEEQQEDENKRIRPRERARGQKSENKKKMFWITHQHLRQVLPKEPGRDGICGYTIRTE